MHNKYLHKKYSLADLLAILRDSWLDGSLQILENILCEDISCASSPFEGSISRLALLVASRLTLLVGASPNRVNPHVSFPACLSTEGFALLHARPQQLVLGPWL
eukprot:TRINITY_DN3819_c0_g2_i1.p1 TRINITY_DN3819_c0_g2~~TRINITY_DN3819_c0_g2_i1.p1  ORF type:complete len:104 (-),score=5.37 TRINITY_DN3819_c0_g2_i1:180-491(-)